MFLEKTYGFARRYSHDVRPEPDKHALATCQRQLRLIHCEQHRVYLRDPRGIRFLLFNLFHKP